MAPGRKHPSYVSKTIMIDEDKILSVVNNAEREKWRGKGGIDN